MTQSLFYLLLLNHPLKCDFRDQMNNRCMTLLSLKFCKQLCHYKTHNTPLQHHALSCILYQNKTTTYVIHCILARLYFIGCDQVVDDPTTVACYYLAKQTCYTTKPQDILEGVSKYYISQCDLCLSRKVVYVAAFSGNDDD